MNTQIVFVFDGEIIKSFVQILLKLKLNKNFVTVITKNDFFLNESELKNLNKYSNLILLDKIKQYNFNYTTTKSSSMPFFIERFFSYGTFAKLTESSPYPKKKSKKFIGIYNYLYKILKKNSVVFGYSNATYYENFIREICIQKKINYLILKHTRIENYFSLFNLTNNKFVTTNINNIDKLNNIKLNSYIGERNKNLYKLNFNYLIKAVFAILFGRSREIANSNYLFIRIINVFIYLFIKIFIHKARMTIKKILGIIFSSKKNNHKKILLPLMAEPEVNMAEFAFPFINTFELIKGISILIPDDYELIIKDHPRNFMWRSVIFGFKVSRLNNVKYIWSFDKPFSDKVDLTIGFNGNIIKEKILNNEKVFTFCNTVFDNYKFNNHKKIIIKDLYREIINTKNTLGATSFHSHKEEVDKFIKYFKTNSIRLNFMTDIVGKKGRSKQKNLSISSQIDSISAIIKQYLKINKYL